MQIKIQQIVRPLSLSDYAPEYEGVALQVWVNPPKALTDERLEQARQANALRERIQMRVSGQDDPVDGKASMESLVQALAVIGQATLQWLVQIWSQGPAETHMSTEDIVALNQADEALYQWLLAKSWGMILDYRNGQKKSV